MANPTTASWVIPTQNTDGSTIAAGEITGYQLGARPAAGTAGTYPIMGPPGTNPAATSEALADLGALLVPGDYFGAVQVLVSPGNTPSAWSNEAPFTISQPQPNPCTGFSVA